MPDWKDSFWSMEAVKSEKKLDTAEDGLSEAEASKRLAS
jgi:hypothetical protein